MSDYFLFLKNKVDLNDTFNDILIEMYNMPFKSYLEKDDARVADGLSLRKDYKGADPLSDSDPVSVLEVIIALAIRMEIEYVSDLNTYRIRETFLRLIDNLGLLKISNKGKARLILNNFVNRTYRPNGVGGLFPMKNTVRDQREVDLWSQMNEYISENYIY